VRPGGSAAGQGAKQSGLRRLKSEEKLSVRRGQTDFVKGVVYDLIPA